MQQIFIKSIPDSKKLFELNFEDKKERFLPQDCDLKTAHLAELNERSAAAGFLKRGIEQKATFLIQQD